MNGPATKMQRVSRDRLSSPDEVLESISIRLEEAMKGAGVTVAVLQAQALEERATIVEDRYGSHVPPDQRANKSARNTTHKKPRLRKSRR